MFSSFFFQTHVAELQATQKRWISEAPMSDSDDILTLVLMESYITLMIRIGH